MTDPQPLPGEVDLRSWAASDMPLLEHTVGDPEMTRYLGGAETPERMRERHERYLALGDADLGRMLVIVVGSERAAAGTHGYWRREESGTAVWETGWFVLPAFQGRGIATWATQLVVAMAWADAPERPIHAYPAVDNGASNSVCRKAGFRLIGAFDFEYPPAHILRCNDWVRDPPASMAGRSGIACAG